MADLPLTPKWLQWVAKEDRDPTDPGMYLLWCRGDSGEYVDGFQVTPGYPDHPARATIGVDPGDKSVFITGGEADHYDWNYDVIAWFGPIPELNK